MVGTILVCQLLQPFVDVVTRLAHLREFTKRIGVTKMDNTVEMGVLEACIREDLNDNAPRAMAVLDPIKASDRKLSY